MDTDPNWTEYLIQAVQNRPFLYDKTLPGYSDKEEKRKSWTEVCEEVIENWASLNKDEKALKENEVQQRWKNLRSCFTRELREQRRGREVGHSGRRRRKYVYFDQLLFLLPTLEDRSAADDMQQMSPRRQEALDWEGWMTDVKTEEDLVSVPSPMCLYPNAATRSNKRSGSYDTPESMLDMVKKREEHDEDKLFLLSLLPAMKRLKGEHKFEAKIELLKVMSRFHTANCGQVHYAPSLPLSSLYYQTRERCGASDRDNCVPKSSQDNRDSRSDTSSRRCRSGTSTSSTAIAAAILAERAGHYADHPSPQSENSSM